MGRLGWTYTHHCLGLRGRAGGCAQVTAGPKRPHLGLCPGQLAPSLAAGTKLAQPGSRASGLGQLRVLSGPWFLHLYIISGMCICGRSFLCLLSYLVESLVGMQT